MRRKQALTRVHQPSYTVEIQDRRYTVIDMVRASQIVETIRDRSGAGASEMGAQFPVRDGLKIIGYVSYNGRVWAGRPEDAGTDRVHLVYDPSEKAHRDAYQIPRGVTSSRVVRNNPIRKCDLHDAPEECQADPSSCRYGGCDAHGDRGPECLTHAQHYADTKSFMCDAGRKQFLKEMRWDDRRGEWVARRKSS